MQGSFGTPVTDDNRRVVRSFPERRSGHSAVYFNEYMFMWGGYAENQETGDNLYYPGDKIWIYSSLSGKWFMTRSTTEYSPSFCASAVARTDEWVYQFGGFSTHFNGLYLNDLHKLNLETLQWSKLNPSGPLPSPVDKLVAWTYGKRFFIFGGFGVQKSSNNNTFEFEYYHTTLQGWTNQFFEYDTETNTWCIPLYNGILPTPRAAHAAAVVKDKAYVFGGRLKGDRLNDTHCFDMRTMSWSGKIETRGDWCPPGRSWHSLTALSDRYLILYGGFNTTNTPLCDCWRFDTETLCWEKIYLPFERPRLWHSACCNMYDEVLVFGGCSTDILSSTYSPQHESEIIVIRTTPKSLYRQCLQAVAQHTQLYSAVMKALPRNISKRIELLV